jgi:hypothetical protein
MDKVFHTKVAYVYYNLNTVPIQNFTNYDIPYLGYLMKFFQLHRPYSAELERLMINLRHMKKFIHRIEAT